MRIVIPNTAAALAVAASIAWPTGASALSDLILNVDCASGGRISQALNRPTLVDRRLVVVVNGTCTENVVIERDDVVLRAHASGGGVTSADATKPAILINGARRVALEGLSVVGGRHGVQVTGGAAAAIRGSAIRNAVVDGVRIDSSSSGMIDVSTVENNGDSGVAALGATLTITGSTVSSNALYGVAVARGSSATLGNESAGSVCCGNTIANNVFDGVLVSDSSIAFLYGNTIEGNGTTNSRFGVLAVRQSSVVLRGGNLLRQNGSTTAGGGILARASSIQTGPGDTPLSPTTNQISGNTFGIQGASNSLVDLRGGASVTGNTFTGVVVDQGSRFRTDGSTISANGAHGVFVGRASSADFIGGGNVVSGNTAFGLFCGDVESSHSGNVAGIAGNTAGQVSCTGF